MNNYTISNDFFEIISGTTNKLHPAYMEASKNVDKDSTKSIGYIKNFITSIEKIASKEKVKNENISSTKGNIKKFKAYDKITSSINFLKKHFKGVAIVNQLDNIYKSIENYQPLYTEAYEKNIRLIVLEYECALDMLVTGLSMTIAENIDVEQNGTNIKIKIVKNSSNGITYKTIADLSKQLTDKNHKKYIEEIIKSKEYAKVDTDIKESVTFMESTVSSTIELIDAIMSNVGKIGRYTINIVRTIKNSLFGIIPLIRSCIYLRYKRKADTILALEQQVEFVEQNIERLENRTNIDPKEKEIIIKKQKAVIEGYKKKAAKLRAQLSDGEREAVDAIEKENPSMKNTDDEFVLENGMTVSDFFSEGSKLSKQTIKRSIKPIRKFRGSPLELANIRKDNFINKKPIKNTFKQSSNNDIDISKTNAIVKKVIDDIIKETKMKSIRLNPGKMFNSDDDMNKRTDTKIGGIPYWPKDQEYPSRNGDPMIMIAQLNFSKLPKLEGYPSSGLMQFFISGAEWEDIGRGTNTRVIYHDNLVSIDDMMKSVPRSTLNSNIPDDKYFPIGGVYYPSASIQEISMNPSNDEWSSILVKYLNKHFNQNWKSWMDVPAYIDNCIWDNIPKDYAGCRIGGHPYFTQNDVRKKDDDILLLQLDSEAGMMWGDCGVANFFTNKETLQNKNFDKKVLFTWDCC